MQSTWRALLQIIELMLQNQGLGFRLTSQFAAVGQQMDEKEGNCNHSAIML
jgi:hypothetical protein